MDQVWWGRVPNALAFTSDITRNLLDGKSVIIQSEQSIPWYETMAAHIKDIVIQQDYSKSFEVIRNVDDPGPYLLQEYCKAEKRAEYRPAKGYARFFAESDDIVLHTRYFWVYIESKETLVRWSEFVSEYRKLRGKNRETAVFILEMWGDKVSINKKGIRTVCYNDYINEYDRIVFSMLASSGIKENAVIKNYLAELSATVSEADIELCAVCLAHYRDFLNDPYKLIQEISVSSYRSNGAPFYYTRTNEEISRYIWLAQIKTIYPLIEKFRGDFVDKYAEAIAKELPITSSYGEEYDDPKDVELGTLVFMADRGRLLLSSSTYHRLERFKDARNRLSHLGVLSFDEIQALIQ